MILMLDEPAAGLGFDERAELGALMTRLASDWGIGILLVEHDVELVMSVSDRMVVLNFGRVLAQGPPAVIRYHPEVVRAYLGDTQGANATIGDVLTEA
jgi:sulfate-transporting ATPase